MSTQAKLIPLNTQFPRMTPYPKAPGEFRFEDIDHHAAAPPLLGTIGRFNHACPNGTGNCGSIVIGNGFKPPSVEGKYKHTWQWDGNVESPTLHPSINCLSCNPNNPAEKYAGCGWHGWLQNGEFR